jgi:uncharacterized protein
MTHSALYRGTLAHARRAPAHRFAYDVTYLYLDLDELAAGALRLEPWLGIERARPFSFRRRDYHGDPARSLAAAVADTVERALGERPRGPIRLLTQVRWLGYVFNPVSFYYCFDGGRVAAVLAEVNNTPWNERHAYVVRGLGGDFAKEFHVSPFFPMTQRYRWRFSEPGPRLAVAMDNDDAFSARLTLARRPLTAGALAREALARPFASWRTHAAIYRQALRLFLAGAPFFSHPRTSHAETSAPLPRP